MPTQMGRIVSFWRYPVKSMMGEELNASGLTESGLIGDRAFALIDSSNGKTASAKNPAKWKSLFDCRAAFVQPPLKAEDLPPVRITLPDGSAVLNDQKDVNEILSSVCSRAVKLMAAAPGPPVLEEYWPDVEGLAHKETVTDESHAASSPRGTFFDYAVIHILTTNTLEWLRELYPPGRFETRRFRPNIVIQVDGEKGFIENGWVGKTLLLGDQVALQVTDPCARCVMTTLPQGDLPADTGILRTAAQHNKVTGGEAAGPEGVYPAVVGVYARVLRSGNLVRGDSIRLE